MSLHRHTPEHDAWDAGGYCNALVADEEGYGDVCGYRRADDAGPLPGTTAADLRALGEAFGALADALADAFRPLADAAARLAEVLTPARRAREEDP